VFLALALSFGSLFVFLTPPLQVPDEEAHLLRSYQLSEGRIISEKRGLVTGDTLPTSLQTLILRFRPLFGRSEQKTTSTDILSALSITYNLEDRSFLGFSRTAIHPPLPYFPQTLGIFFARICSSSVLVSLYSGRLVNVLAAIALTFFAIRCTPIGKWTFAALALTPMAVFQAASLSPDALTNALSFLFTAKVFQFALGKDERVSSRRALLLCLLGAGIALTKQVYFLLPLCYVLIPASRVGSPWRYWNCFALVMATTLFAVMSWGSVVRAIYSPADLELGIGMDPQEQFRAMRNDPFEFLLVVWRTFLLSPVYATQYMGGLLGWLDTPLAAWIVIFEFVFLVMILVTDFDPQANPTGRQAVLALMVALLVSLTIVVIIHLTWDPVGLSYVVLQGRYFIPIGPLVGLAASWLGHWKSSAISKVSQVIPIAVTLCVPLILSSTLVCIHDRYFVDSEQAALKRAIKSDQAVSP
jgi:uncharacterized membrane protein